MSLPPAPTRHVTVRVLILSYGMSMRSERGVHSKDIVSSIGYSSQGTTVLKVTWAVTSSRAARRRLR
ncbi:hypothetical protein E2C01_015414 [Portunus trituberculatus]|uniref:Uncharacterized protein n=1 Tax=Portunus trituberculatus TaxID=210409 RepID=A0A5B7DLL1_PORTR|nr:hypothetical protein [Portunus trituberculatus]